MRRVTHYFIYRDLFPPSTRMQETAHHDDYGRVERSHTFIDEESHERRLFHARTRLFRALSPSSPIYPSVCPFSWHAVLTTACHHLYRIYRRGGEPVAEEERATAPVRVAMRRLVQTAYIFAVHNFADARASVMMAAGVCYLYALSRDYIATDMSRSAREVQIER